jgi:hypothetical protein
MPEPRIDWSAWHKSSYSKAGNCIETRDTCDRVQVRDSKSPDGPMLTFGREAWITFLAQVKRGDFEVSRNG